ncbi:MAG: helix-turn-helix domain-containing protein [Lachnospiraceae bacterium]|nr:helix-turn-helix domain-containing protein [Lachnospiraceae bacterium]
MDTKKPTKRKIRPTMQQLGYLSELLQTGNGRGALGQIAETCGVNHSSVVRYLKTCVENGYLNPDYSFTKSGLAYIQSYQQLIEELRMYLRRIGIPDQELDENVRDMVENMDYYTLSSMIRNDLKMKNVYSVEKQKHVTTNFIGEILRYGNFKVQFMIYRMSEAGGGPSMADRGFEKPANLKHNKRGSWLELKICDMNAHSRGNGENMIGHMKSLKYEQSGVMHEADIRDNIVRIPLQACRYHCSQGGAVRGMIPITLTCSVGRTHMPESTALLIFWL